MKVRAVNGLWAVAGAGLLAACNDLGDAGRGGGEPANGQGATTTTTENAASGGEACQWPSGGYGVSAGSFVAPDLAWQGYPAGSSKLATISIHDYFDCDGTKGETALLILQAATWCGACQKEASTVGGMLSDLTEKGIHVITLLIQNQSGSPATPQTALAWKKAFRLGDEAVAADPHFSFVPQSGRVGLPLSILVDPRTMEIVHVEEGFSGDFTAAERLAQRNERCASPAP